MVTVGADPAPVRRRVLLVPRGQRGRIKGSGRLGRGGGGGGEEA